MCNANDCCSTDSHVNSIVPGVDYSTLLFHLYLEKKTVTDIGHYLHVRQTITQYIRKRWPSVGLPYTCIVGFRCSIRPTGVRQGQIQDFGLGAGRALKAPELRRRRRRMGWGGVWRRVSIGVSIHRGHVPPWIRPWCPITSTSAVAAELASGRRRPWTQHFASPTFPMTHFASFPPGLEAPDGRNNQTKKQHWEMTYPKPGF